ELKIQRTIESFRRFMRKLSSVNWSENRMSESATTDSGRNAIRSIATNGNAITIAMEASRICQRMVFIGRETQDVESMYPVSRTGTVATASRAGLAVLMSRSSQTSGAAASSP